MNKKPQYYLIISWNNHTTECYGISFIDDKFGDHVIEFREKLHETFLSRKIFSTIDTYVEEPLLLCIDMSHVIDIKLIENDSEVPNS